MQNSPLHGICMPLCPIDHHELSDVTIFHSQYFQNSHCFGEITDGHLIWVWKSVAGARGQYINPPLGHAEFELLKGDLLGLTTRLKSTRK